MKKLTVSLLLACSSQLLLAQVPLEFNYQAVARDNKGLPLADKDINVRFSIRSENASGSVEYMEIRKLRTNMFGMFSVSIGSGNAYYSSGSLVDVKWSKGKKFLGVEIDFETNGNYIDMGATQMVSVPYALFAGKSVDTVRGGQGISLKNGNLDLGYTKDEASSPFKESRYLFLNDNDLRLKDGNAEIIFSKEGLTIQQDSALMENDNWNSGGVFFKVNPIYPREDALPFLFSRVATTQHNGATSPNEIVLWGHNLSPGGSSFIKGLPAIGYSLESNYQPEVNERIVESHEYYVNPQGKQIRLKSYTIKTDVDDIDYYQTISRIYLKNPLSNEEYFHVNTSKDNMAQTLAIGNFKILQSREEKDGNSMSQTQFIGNDKYSELFLNSGWKYIYLPGLMFQENGLLRLMGNLVPENDNQYHLGHFSNRFATINSITYKGQKAIFKSNWAETENILPTSTLDIEGENGFDQLRLRKTFTPARSNDPNGQTGDISWDDDFIYIKTAKGWKRTSLSDF